MAKRIFLILAITTALFSTAAMAETFGAVLTGAQEVPANNSTGFGNATVTLDPAHTSFRVQMAVTGLSSNIIDAHIHGPNGPAGVNAGVLVGLTPGVNLVNGRMDMTFPISKENGDAIAANPSNFYLNVHTTNFPGGEIRGQLTALDTVTVLAAELRGANEVPPNSSTATGSALITVDQNNRVTWDINANGLTPTRGHIHEQVAGVNGSIVVNFTDNAADFNPGARLRGSGTITDAALANRLRTNPSGFYVNLHSAQFPGGEIRGQLTAANEYDVAVAGKVTGANGENFVTNVRIFNPSFTSRATALVEYFPTNTPGTTPASLAVDIAPRGTAVLNDIAGTTGLNVAAGTGGLRVTSARELVVSSTIFDDRRARNGGTIGQFVPAVRRSDGLRRGVLAQLANNSESRTNVGFFNPNATTVNVRLELRDDAGTLLGQGTVDLAALSHRQNSIGTFFSGVDVTNRANLTVTFDASAPIVAYASNVDNASADQIYIFAIEDPGVAP
jgi:hypothetical protein